MKIENIVFVVAVMFCTTFVTPASSFEVLGTATPDSMEKPSPLPIVSGTKFHWLKNEKEYVVTYESVDAEVMKGMDSEGCSWTSMTYAFAPSLSWSNCSGRSGTQKIKKAKGSPWPMSSETKFQYSFRGKAVGGGKPWSSTRKCEVAGQERVKVPAGEFDTYKVVCEDKWNTRTTWVSPELGHGVAAQRKHKTDNTRSYMLELVKVAQP